MSDRDASKDQSINSLSEEFTVPIAEESVRVGKRKVETGRVRVSKKSLPEEVHLTEDLERDEIEIDRVPMQTTLLERPEIRVEGDTTIIPVVEEVLQVSKQYRLREEIRIRRITQHEKKEVATTIDKEVATVDRLSVDPSTNANKGQ